MFAQLELDFNCEWLRSSNGLYPVSDASLQLYIAVERIGEYLDVEQEAAAVSVKPPPAYWPSSSGGISVEVRVSHAYACFALFSSLGDMLSQDLVIKYGPHLPPVLKGISFTVRPREKVGVVGRTGSGKSTLAMSLLRIVEPTAGRIV